MTFAAHRQLMTDTLDPTPYVSSTGSRFSAAEAEKSGGDLKFCPRDAVINRSAALRRLLASGAPEAGKLIDLVEVIRDFRPSRSNIDLAAQVIEGVRDLRSAHIRVSPSKDVSVHWSDPDLNARVNNGRIFIRGQNLSLKLDNAGDAIAIIVATLSAADNERQALDAVFDGATLALHQNLFDSAVSNGLDMDVLTAAVEEQFGCSAAEAFAAYAASRTNNEFAD